MDNRFDYRGLFTHRSLLGSILENTPCIINEYSRNPDDMTEDTDLDFRDLCVVGHQIEYAKTF